MKDKMIYIMKSCSAMNFKLADRPINAVKLICEGKMNLETAMGFIRASQGNYQDK